MRSIGVALVFGVATLVASAVQAEIKPEVVTVEKAIAPGPNLYLLTQSWSGASTVTVYNEDDLQVKGNVPGGVVSQAVVSKDHASIYMVSSFPKRIVSGALETALQEFDAKTLTLKREILVSDKFVQSGSSDGLMALSASGDYLYIQNATPASSVTVVDLLQGKPIAEVPTPGCFGIYPATADRRFTTLCGDGTLMSFSHGKDGSYPAARKSEKLFDVDKDALYLAGFRDHGDLLFVSFNGAVYRFDDSGEQVSLKKKVSIVGDLPGSWAPGGKGRPYAYNAANNMLFVLMHPDAKEGSHKDPAREVWAFDLVKGKVLYRSPVTKVASLYVTTAKTPTLFGLDDDKTLTRYEVDPEAKFAVKLTHTLNSTGNMIIAGE